MKLWRIKSPDYDSDYRDTYINGSLEHPFGLPGVICDICGETWGGSRILPFPCPDAFKKHKNIINRWPITRKQHENLQHELMAALSIQGKSFTTFRPGDSFQPSFLDVPSWPDLDFLWSSLGSFVVSERIKNLLVINWPEDVIFCPVTPRKIGENNAKLPPPVPSTGEPEDMIDEVPLTRNSLHNVSYFEILIQKQSRHPPGVSPETNCGGCGRSSSNRSTSDCTVSPEMWNGENIFFLRNTLHVFVTDDVRNRLLSVQASNVIFK